MLIFFFKEQATEMSEKSEFGEKFWIRVSDSTAKLKLNPGYPAI
jgi:hypothetical protein